MIIISGRVRIFFLFLIICFFAGNDLIAQTSNWKIVPGRITTSWADSVSPANVLNEYPRPQMQRDHWWNLNGLWQYAKMVKTNDENIPVSYDGNILVPFAIESALSGVGKTVGKDSVLWYNRVITIPSKIKNKRILLHFGAVDWRSDVYVNGKHVGSHEGGYDPFTIDITKALNKGNKQQLSVRVCDPTNDGTQPHGKQVINLQVIWYASVTGIWQTVWLETVPETYIVSTKQTQDVDNQSITISTSIQNFELGDLINISIWNGNVKIAEKKVTDTFVTVSIINPQLWSPSNPYLYDLKVAVIRKGKVVDKVKSYFAMRKISMAADQNGIQKMKLNNKFLFEYGPLDQRWWPDGLYTDPTDAALKFDIEKTKEMGFNMIRKHIKVEPARWYYYCDKLGMIVWQDMPSGDLGNRWEPRPGVLGRGTDRGRSESSKGYYRKEWNAIMETLHNFLSIVVWIPFNEAWGQFKTKEITEWTMKKDPSRLVNSASGGNYYDGGDIIDLHNYPDPAMPRPDIFGKNKLLVLGEFGRLGLPVECHTWQQKNWGYQSFKSNDSLFKRYNSLIEHLEKLVWNGLSAAVYTQTTDVESEVNGFMTYDRKIMKMPINSLRKVN